MGIVASFSLYVGEKIHAVFGFDPVTCGCGKRAHQVEGNNRLVIEFVTGQFVGPTQQKWNAYTSLLVVALEAGEIQVGAGIINITGAAVVTEEGDERVFILADLFQCLDHFCDSVVK